MYNIAEMDERMKKNSFKVFLWNYLEYAARYGVAHWEQYFSLRVEKAMNIAVKAMLDQKP